MITLFLNELIKALKNTNAHKELIKQFTAKDFPLYIGNIRGSVLSAVISDLKSYTKGDIAVVFPTEKEADIFYQDTKILDDNALRFPSWETLPYSDNSPSSRIYATEYLQSAGYLEKKRVKKI